MNKNTSIWENIGLFAVTLIIFVFTFPEISPSHGPGIDEPLSWAFNYIFANGSDMGRHIVFPHGPLAFLMYPLPLGNNLDIAFWVLSLTRLIFIFTLFKLGSAVAPEKWLLHAALAIMLMEIVAINLVLTGGVAAALIVFHFTGKRWWLSIPILFTVIGLYTRASIGITNSIIMVSYACIYLYQKRDFKVPLYVLGSFPVLLFLFWLMIYGSFEGFFNYFAGTLQLTKGSSAATSYYPDNNWLVLGAAMVLFFAFPFIAKNSKVNFVYGLFLLSIFAVWKHGMSREDLLHARGFFCYLVLFFTLILLSFQELKKRHFLTIGVILALVYRNLVVTYDYREYKPEIWSVNQFFRWIEQRDIIAEEGLRESEGALAVQKLPQKWLDRIGDATVDVYPWDFSFIPANGLIWKPRVVIQSYASYTPWLDGKNASFFAKHQGAEFIIWDMVEDQWGGNFSSIDDRYVLNNEPQTILQILDNYSVVDKCDKAILFERDKGNHLSETEIAGDIIKIKWSEWIKVPELQDGIQRARVNIRGTFWRFMKNQLFKDEAYYVEYKLNNGEIKRYRIVPDIAALGLWVNPLIMQPQNDFMEPTVTDIRFTCTNYKAVRDEIEIQWEYTSVNNSSEGANVKFQSASGLFGKNTPEKEKLVMGFLNDLEEPYQHWHVDESKVKTGKAFSGNHFFEMEKGGYSHTFEFTLDSIYNQGSTEISVSVNAQVKVKDGGKLALVVSVSDENEQYFWEAVNTEMLGVQHNAWSPLYFKKQISLKKGAKIKTFLWNVGEKKACADDIEVKIYY